MRIDRRTAMIWGSVILTRGVDALVPLTSIPLLMASPLPTPPLSGDLDPLLIDDGPEGLTAHSLYASRLQWKNPGGDWLDADGVQQGSKPFGLSAPFVRDQTGQVMLNVTPLVKQGEWPQIVLRGVGPSTTAIFTARESATPPKLTITYTDGSTATMVPVADAEANLSTWAAMGSQVTFQVCDGGPNTYIRFPQPDKPVVSAQLSLTINRIFSGGRIGAFRFAIHLDPIPTEHFTLKGDPRIFFETEAFEDAGVPYYIKVNVFGGPESWMKDAKHQRTVVTTEDGRRALQVTFDPTENGALSASICFPEFDEADEAAWEFDIRLLPDMLTGPTDGFKLFAGCSSSTTPDDLAFSKWAGTNTPGRCGTLLAGNGGAKSHGNDGWSLRWDCHKSPPRGHPLYGRFLPMQYVYWPGQSDFYGDSLPWLMTHKSLQVGRWYTVTQRAKVNTCVGTNYLKDAEFDGYIDHTLAVRHRDFYLRTTDDPLIAHDPTTRVKSKLAIGRIWLNTYHGGTAFPTSRCSFQVRSFRAAVFKRTYVIGNQSNPPTSKVPKWLQNKAVNEWVSIQRTAMSDYDLSVINAAGLNPGQWEYGSPVKGIFAFSGGTVKGGNTLLIFGGGGAGGWAGNEVRALDLSQDAPRWTTLIPPSNANAVWSNRTGSPEKVSHPYMKDGKPNARHSYWEPQFIDASGEFMAFGCSNVWESDNGQWKNVDSYNLARGAWNPPGTNPDLPWNRGWDGNLIVKHPVTEDVYAFFQEKICVWRHLTNAWSDLCSPSPFGRWDKTFGAVDHHTNSILIIGKAIGGRLAHRIDCKNGVITGGDLVGPYSKEIVDSINVVAQSDNASGIAYDPGLRAFLVYQCTQKMFKLTPRGNDWYVDILPLTGTPPLNVPDCGGLWGRFQYLPTLRGVVIMQPGPNGGPWNQNTFFVKTS